MLCIGFVFIGDGVVFRVVRVFLNYLKLELSGVVGVIELNREELDIIVFYFWFCGFYLFCILLVCILNNNFVFNIVVGEN